VIETIIWILLALIASVWFFSIIEDWADIGPLDDDTPEDP
jgi:hypothetical protein